MIVHTLKMCTGEAGPEQSLVLLAFVLIGFSSLSSHIPTGSYLC